MKLVCNLKFDFDSDDVANAVARAIKIDDEGFVATEVKNNKICAVIEADSINSLLHTLEDYLVCVNVAEKAAQTGLGEP